MAEGAEPSLLGEQLLVGHRVDGVREGEGRAARRHHIHVGNARWDQMRKQGRKEEVAEERRHEEAEKGKGNVGKRDDVRKE